MVNTPPPSPPPTPKAAPTKTLKKASKKAPKASNMTEASTSATTAGASNPPKPGGKIDAALKRRILALKMSGMTTKDIANAVNRTYNATWKVIDSTMKAKAKLGENITASDIQGMTETDKKDAALALKLAGWKTTDIATQLDIKYNALWKFFDQQQKAANEASGSDAQQ